MRLIFDQGREGRRCSIPPTPIAGRDLSDLPASALRSTPPALPQVSEIELVRHYTALSHKTFGVDDGFYPLGSCTMKYNPKVNEAVAALPGFADSHPLAPESAAQGSLAVLYHAQRHLAELTGMDAVTLTPAAGAHGELCGIMMFKAYHKSRGDANRTKVLVPDSAHGTNPASAAMGGYTAVQIPSRPDGRVDLEALKTALGDDIAGLMLTNPNTLGLFERDIEEIARLVHEAGGLLYYDGANFNAIMGVIRPGDMGFDVVHLNLHKSFSTPHGGGGPGSGPVGVRGELVKFLPSPQIGFDGERYFIETPSEHSIGKMRSFHGSFAVVLRALTYILSLGGEGIRDAAESAVLNANYLSHLLKEELPPVQPGVCMHEFVVSCERYGQYGVHATDLAKALIDLGYHPPTMYFPLTVKEALMLEPTETESKEQIEAFAEDLLSLIALAKTEPEKLKAAPATTPVGRPDELTAARKPIVRR